MYLSRFPNVSDLDKKEALLLRIEGYARQIVEQEVHNFTNPEQIFSCLTLTYGRDKRTIMNNTMQFALEPVRIYVSRLRTNLSLIGIVELSSPFVILDYFVKGLLPAISHKVKSLYPNNF